MIFELAKKGLTLGSPIFIRILKTPGVLEMWVENSQGMFTLFKRYKICTFSGELGPKLREGDNQSPEGFYIVKPQQLNPKSRFHLSFNIGFPNAYDKSHGRTGTALMVHGNCLSIGCYAMTDSFINEIYTLAFSALDNGQPYFRVHSFPFEMSSENLALVQDSPWHGFWQNLQEGYDYFETHKRPPNVGVKDKLYIFR